MPETGMFVDGIILEQSKLSKHYKHLCQHWIVDEELMLGLADNDRWERVTKNYNGHYRFYDWKVKPKLFNSLDKAEIVVKKSEKYAIIRLT